MKVFPPSPEVEIVIRRSVGEIKNQVVILEVITHHGNAIRIADVCTKIVEVACL
jgi:hypothetical protein